MNALEGAWLRFWRADAHLAEAQRLVGEFGDACRHHIVADNESNPDKPTFALKTAPNLPTMLPVVVGDAIHNMRAALDYLVFELARMDSGRIQDGTQFLIEDCKIDPANPKRGFDAKSGQRLKGLSRTHIDMIERFQPYAGVSWTKVLRDISNPDKHRSLTAIDHGGNFVFTYRGTADLATQKPLIITPKDWDVDASYAIYVAPANISQPALMPTLREVQLGICQALEVFKAEF